MVQRLQGGLKEVTLVDLDGTLLSANSMHIFMRRLPLILIRRGHLGAAIESLRWVVLRSLRLVSHRTMKWHLTKIARRYLQGSDWENLAGNLLMSINQKVRDYIQSRRERGHLTYIVTAAMEEYALPICSRIGFDGVLATKFTERLSDYGELNRNAKLDAIEKLLHDHQLHLESFLTDHVDDLPTASAHPHVTILVGASDETTEEFRKAGVCRFL